jgi:serine/threonine-protein kinase
MTAQVLDPGGDGRLGDFTLRSAIGHGGTATVYAASSGRHGEVALKVLRADLALSERERERFCEEARCMSRVRHPSLVPLVDAGLLPDGRPYVCMPLLRGETLAVRVERGPLPLEVAMQYLRELADGVTALHRTGMVHRDIKPENVFLEQPGDRAVLLDFGLARDADRSPGTTTRAGAMRGTPAYMAPERFFGAPATVATDIYELAVVAYVMLVGRLPWDLEHDGAARLHPRPPSDFGVALPGLLGTVLLRALSTRPEARPATAAALAEDAQHATRASVQPLARTEDHAAPPALARRHSDDRERRLRVASRRVNASAAASGIAWEATRASGDVVAGKYRLDRLLGQGGMGEVWAATNSLTERPVALKLLRPELVHQQDHRRRILREARVAGTLHHPNVVPILDVIELDDGSPVIVMDLLEGEPLRRALERSRSLTLRETASVLVPVLSAVGSAHARGIVHRDLKPENIFLARVDGRRRVFVLDFGIAKVSRLEGDCASVESLTADGTMLGTPFYMSPEQIYGERDVDRRSDIWALGVILYECLAGRRPTEAESVGQILRIITRSEIVPIEKLRADLPAAVSSVIMAALSSKREDRPSSLERIYGALREHCDEAVPSFGAPKRWVDGWASSSSELRADLEGLRSLRTATHAAIATAALALILGGAAFVLWSRADRHAPEHAPAAQSAAASAPSAIAIAATATAISPLPQPPNAPLATDAEPSNKAQPATSTVRPKTLKSSTRIHPSPPPPASSLPATNPPGDDWLEPRD